jgi:exodeoxyribonuclease VII small subunit
MDQTPIAEMKFEVALGELDAIVASMEGGKLELADAIAAYRRGMELMQHCEKQLTVAEEEIHIMENSPPNEVDRRNSDPA